MSPTTPKLGLGRKSAYALGDLTLSAALSSMSLVYASYFLTQVADLRPALAGLVPLIGRLVDAVTDPLMGELSDRTHTRWGRRRPYLLLGALPFGATFALLWTVPPGDSQLARFAYYTLVYCGMSVAMTVLSVPYLALQPEMAEDYDDRTSLNTYRSVGTQVGTIAAVGIRAVAEAFGGGTAGFALAGLLYGVLVTLPWLAVFRASFERRDHDVRPDGHSFRRGLATALAHPAFSRLTALYIAGRIAMDLAAALIILYVTYWLGRTGDFELVMGLFLVAVMLGLPLWLWAARGREKAHVFIAGSLWWMAASAILFFVQPDWPRWVTFVFVPLVGVGFAAVDLMPWSMLGEVIDEDELLTGQRRDGIYNGVFTFLRKLGGALGVFLVMGVLDLAGFEKGEQQGETARQAIRALTAFAPAAFLALAVWLARGYPLTRVRHRQILRGLDARGRA